MPLIYITGAPGSGKFAVRKLQSRGSVRPIEQVVGEILKDAAV